MKLREPVCSIFTGLEPLHAIWLVRAIKIWKDTSVDATWGEVGLSVGAVDR